MLQGEDDGVADHGRLPSSLLPQSSDEATAIANAEPALKTPPPPWGMLGRGKPRFGARQSSLASPTPTHSHVGGGGMMLDVSRCDALSTEVERADCCYSLGGVNAPTNITVVGAPVVEPPTGSRLTASVPPTASSGRRFSATSRSVSPA